MQNQKENKQEYKLFQIVLITIGYYYFLFIAPTWLSYIWQSEEACNIMCDMCKKKKSADVFKPHLYAFV